MTYYWGITVRRETLKRDRVKLSLKMLREIAQEIVSYYSSCVGEPRMHVYVQPPPRVRLRRALPHVKWVREYVVEPETDLKMKISLESVNNAPFNAWIKIPTRIANLSGWNFMVHLAKHLSNRFPKITFVVASGRAPSPFMAKHPYNPPCPEDEKHIYLYKGGRVMEKLTWMEWARKYLLVEASFLSF